MDSLRICDTHKISSNVMQTFFSYFLFSFYFAIKRISLFLVQRNSFILSMSWVKPEYISQNNRFSLIPLMQHTGKSKYVISRFGSRIIENIFIPKNFETQIFCLTSKSFRLLALLSSNALCFRVYVQCSRRMKSENFRTGNNNCCERNEFGKSAPFLYFMLRNIVPKWEKSGWLC